MRGAIGDPARSPGRVPESEIGAGVVQARADGARGGRGQHVLLAPEGRVAGGGVLLRLHLAASRAGRVPALLPHWLLQRLARASHAPLLALQEKPRARSQGVGEGGRLMLSVQVSRSNSKQTDTKTKTLAYACANTYTRPWERA